MNETFKSDQKKLTANIKAGGCAAKLGSKELEEILADIPVLQSPQLIAGIEGFEDAAVYKISEDIAIIQTIDFFPPLLDDPFIYGQIAAANALSDVYAMGGRPVLALNVLCFPTCDYPLEVVKKILEGGASKVAEAGASLAGGHSIQISEPVYGLSLMGLVSPDRIFTNSGALENDALILTKPIGVGVALLGMKGGQLKAASQDDLINNLTSLNKDALEATEGFPVNAMTDITGFGLAGHLHEMAKSSGLSAEVYVDRIEFFDGVVELAQEGFVPAGAYGNRQSFSEVVTYKKDLNLAIQDLLFDPQTSGGLLISTPEKSSDELVARLKSKGLKASKIGCFVSAESTGENKGHVFFS